MAKTSSAVETAKQRGGEYLTAFLAGMEEAARVSEQQDRTGREWVADSLWANIVGRVPRAIRREIAQIVLDASK